MRHLTVVILSWILFSSCEEKKENAQIEVSSGPFYSISQKVLDDSQTLQSQACGITRTVLIKEKKETLKQDSVEWSSELKAIAMADINKTAWIPNIKTDTIIKGSEKIVRYTTLSPKIPVKYIDIHLDSLNVVKRIVLERSTKNLFFSSRQKIDYQPGIGYNAEGEQNALFLSEQKFTIEAIFNCKP